MTRNAPGLDKFLTFAFFFTLAFGQLQVHRQVFRNPVRPCRREHWSHLFCERQIQLGGLAVGDVHWCRPCALEAGSSTLHGVFSRRELIGRVTALRLADDHEGQPARVILQFHKRSGDGLPGCILDNTLDDARVGLRPGGLNSDEHEGSRDQQHRDSIERHLVLLL